MATVVFFLHLLTVLKLKNSWTKLSKKFSGRNQKGKIPPEKVEVAYNCKEPLGNRRESCLYVLLF